jgi:hypothetical protein
VPYVTTVTTYPIISPCDWSFAHTTGKDTSLSWPWV